MGIKTTMFNHHYIVGEEIRRQLDGGPIGSELTGAVARAYMIWWDDQFMRKCQDAGVLIEMYERYIDDGNICAEATEIGVRYNGETGQLDWSEAAMMEDEGMEDDQRTAKVIKDIANNIHPMIVMEEDYPSKHTDRRLPILDLACWVEDNQLWFRHYEKSVSSKKLIPKRSALPLKVKRNVFVNECVRRLKNCSLELPWEEKANFLTDYMARLKVAGYNQKFRMGILKQAVARYEGMLEANRDGKQPLYRSKEWQKQNRNMAGAEAGGGRKKKNSDWITKGGLTL